MLSLQRTWTAARTLLRPLTRPPSLCQICRRWQGDLVCAACLRDWGHSVNRCTRCAIDLPRGHLADVCATCEDQSPDVDRTIAAVHYAPPWSPLLTQLKFREGCALAKPLGHLLAQAVTPRLRDERLVLPIPLSPSRLHERGYNQSWLLTQEVARRLQLDSRYDVLSRNRHTNRLMSLSAEERQAHIRKAFSVPAGSRPRIKGRDIALVDDVMTTGATLNAAASALLDAGARSVSAWVVARTPAPTVVDRILHSVPPHSDATEARDNHP